MSKSSRRSVDSEQRQDVGGEPFHLLGVVVERVQHQQVGSRVEDGLQHLRHVGGPAGDADAADPVVPKYPYSPSSASVSRAWATAGSSSMPR